MSESTLKIDPIAKENLDRWLKENYDPDTKAEIKRLLEQDPKRLSDAFYTNLTFGTGGLRGIMGVGTNRMNNYTVRATTQGLANYLKKQPGNHSVCIGYDSRHHSRDFAEESSKVLTANGIKVYLFKDLRPTPLVSFALREKGCSAGIMITASHNPPEYNGYKVYWNDGGQVIAPHDQGIIIEANQITNLSQVHVADTLDVTYLDEELDAAYMAAVLPLQQNCATNLEKGSDLKIVYTSLHGTGITMTPQVLASWGFTNITLVEKQVIPDGDFPTALKPNPEERAALTLGIETLEKIEGDLLIATDPDADRVGIAVRHKGNTELLNGNQVAALCLEHICSSGELPTDGAFIKTIGTTELFQAIATHYERPCFNVLTGFKFIAGLIHEWEQAEHGYQYIFGGEESYGYLQGTYTRDKDAPSTAALIAEMTLQAKLDGFTLVDKLHQLYEKYGFYHEQLLSLSFDPGQEGQFQMKSGMKKLREHPPKEFAGIAVSSTEDFLEGKGSFPKSDVLLFWLEDGSKLMVRPSGTEPKVKIYCGIVEKNFHSINDAKVQAKRRADKLLNSIQFKS